MPAQPQRTSARKTITSRPYYREYQLSAHEATPSLGSVSASDDNDRSSNFELETPTKQTKTATIQHESSDDEYDIKPDISVDGWNGDGSGDEDEDVNPKIKTPSKGRGKGGSKTKTNVPSSSSKKSSTGSAGGGGPKKLGQAWTGEEDWALFQYLHPKIKPDWKNAAAAVGRDAKVSPFPSLTCIHR